MHMQAEPSPQPESVRQPRGSAGSLLRQRDLFEHVAEAYAASATGALSNDELYAAVARRAGLEAKDVERKVPIGRAGAPRSPVLRQVRWKQQDLRKLGLIERVEGERGIWKLTDAGEKKLRRARPDVALLVFSTELGVAIWGSCRRVFPLLDQPIALCVTSPPYPLRQPRAYGNPPASQYVDFICGALEPIVAGLLPGGSLCLNVSNDIFEVGSPARSTYLERLVIALEDRLGLSLMDRLVWHNPSKPPGPVQWASLTRVQLNQSWEPVLWLTNDPQRVRSDNRRVLEPHSERHLRLMAGGGERRTAQFADGAYRIKPGSYGKPTEGRIPRNVLKIGHRCADQLRYRRDAAALGLPAHGAPMPLALAEFLVKFLSAPGDLVVDPFGGTLKTARAAENLGRRWLSTEWILDYLRAGAERFRDATGFALHPAL